MYITLIIVSLISHYIRRQQRDESQYAAANMKGLTLLSEGIDDMVGIYYRPKTQDTRKAYECILSLIQKAVGDVVSL